MNFSSMKNYKRLVASVGLATMLTFAVAAPAFAATTSVNAGVVGGSLAATIDASLTAPAIGYSHTSQQVTNPALTLNVDDSSGTGAGWHVTLQSGVFDHTGGDGSTDIAASAFVLGTPVAPSLIDGQAISGTVGEGPEVGVGGSLEAARTVIRAGANFGQGNYGQSLPSTFTYPAQARDGAYTATLTTTAVSGPGL